MTRHHGRPDDDLPSAIPPRSRAVAEALLLFERVMKNLEALAIWFLGDPDWKSRTRIDWSKSVLFRRPWTPSEDKAMRRAADEEIHREYDGPEEKKTPR
jgi:hypothetical protein